MRVCVLVCVCVVRGVCGHVWMGVYVGILSIQKDNEANEASLPGGNQSWARMLNPKSPLLDM